MTGPVRLSSAARRSGILRIVVQLCDVERGINAARIPLCEQVPELDGAGLGDGLCRPCTWHGALAGHEHAAVTAEWLQL
jgi:hypothetical protein